MGMSSTFGIFCLIFGSIHAQERPQPGGVRRFEMHVGGSSVVTCGGKDVKIALIDSRGEVCETLQSDPFSENQEVTWANYRLGNCKHSMKIDSSTKLQIHASHKISCPRKIVIYTRAGERFVSTMRKEEYTPNDNHENHTVAVADESHAGIKKITLKIKNDNCGDNQLAQFNPWNKKQFGCGGKNIQLKLTTGKSQCQTQTISHIAKNHFAFWTGDQLGNCQNLHVEESTFRVSIITDNNDDKFGVELVQIKISDNDESLYDVRGLNFYPILPAWVKRGPKTGQPVGFSTTKTWPPPGGVPQRPRPVVCPKQDEDACPRNEIVAYRVESNENMNCIIECDRVTRTLYSTNLDVTEGTGFGCMQTDYESVQFGYCCNTRIANITMPWCPDVQQTEQTEQTDEESLEVQCPDDGCPLASVKSYYDEERKNVLLECEPDCDFLNGPAYSTNSGFDCYNTTTEHRETKFCCNDIGAKTNLPTCQSIENNQEN